MIQRRSLIRPAALAVLTLCSALANVAPAQVTRGFDTTAEVVATGEERQRQSDLWMFEVSYKPMRMRWVDVTDPRTGEQRREQIWYLAWRAVNRAFPSREESEDVEPVNTLDPVPPQKFIPQFTLITYDDPGTEIPVQVAVDQVIPEAAALINRVERRAPDHPPFLDSVQVVQDLPEAIGADQTEEIPWIYGVATWSGIDPDTDFFKVHLSGFSNGYEVRTGPDGQATTWRKVLVQKFTRRGDRFDPTQIEFEVDGPPEWTYVPQRGGGGVPPAETVARPTAPRR